MTRALLAALLLACSALSSAAPVVLKAADGVAVHGDYRQADKPKALILLFHQAGSSSAEYAPIAPRLNKHGYSTLAIDQRSGDALYGPNLTATQYGKKASYLDAKGDLAAALRWAHEDGRKLPVIVWGSSYSAALVFLLAAEHPKEVAAVVAFSPGEYLGKLTTVRDAARRVKAPVFIASGTDPSDEVAPAKAVFEAIGEPYRTRFVPNKGIHGSSTLRSDKNPAGAEENWEAVLRFLDKLKL